MSANPTKIIETSCNRFYAVSEPTDSAVSHCYVGTEMKRTKAGFVPKKNARTELVRKAATRIVVEA